MNASHFIRCFRMLSLLALFFGAGRAHAAFTLVSTAPQNGDSDIPAAGPFAFTFSDPVRLSSFVQKFSPSTVQLTPPTGAGDVPVAWTFTLSEDRRTVSAAPSVPLREGVSYRLYLSRKGDLYPPKQDNSAGSILAEDEGAPDPVIFTVKDTVAPELRGVFPPDGATGLPTNTRLQFLASEPLDPASIRLTLNGAAAAPRVDATGLLSSASLSLQPSTPYTAVLNGADYGGNPFPPLAWGFTTGPNASPDQLSPFVASADPAPGAAGVPPTVRPVIGFTEPLSPLSVNVALVTCPKGLDVPGMTWDLDPAGDRLTVTPPPLSKDSACYEVRITGADRAGNPLPAPGSPGNALTFTTADLNGPILTAVIPAPDSAVNPATGPDLVLHFSEAVRTGENAAPVLRLEYASGAAPPDLDPRDAVGLGGGRWRLTGPGGDAFKDLTLRVLPVPGDPDGNRYRPGDTLSLHLENVTDVAGNALRDGSVPYPWSFALTGGPPPELVGIDPAEGATAALDAPVVLRFSLPMDPFRLRFEADGDWAASATELFTRDGQRYAPRQWVTNSPAWSADRQVVTLKHVPFPADPSGGTTAHTLRILFAPNPEGKNYVLGPGQTAQRTWLTGSRPHVVSVDFLAPVKPEADLTPEGLLAAPDDPARSTWTSLGDTSELPLNARFRVRVSEPMDAPTLAPPAVVPSGPSAALSPDDATTALVTLNSPLPSQERKFHRSPDGALLPDPPALSLSFTVGYGVSGDPLEPATFPLSPLDVRPPVFRVEYRANPGDPPPAAPDWRPLPDALVPPDVPWRIVADETLAASDAVTLERAGESGPDPAGGYGTGDRDDADGLAGNAEEVAWTHPLATTAMARPGEDFVAASFRVRVRDTRTFAGPNVAEKVVSFRVSVPRRPVLGDLDGSGIFDAEDVDLAMSALLQKTLLTPQQLLAADLVPSDGDGKFDVTDLNALFRLFLHGKPD